MIAVPEALFAMRQLSTAVPARAASFRCASMADVPKAAHAVQLTILAIMTSNQFETRDCYCHYTDIVSDFD